MRALKVLLLILALALIPASTWADGVPDPTIKVGPGGGSTLIPDSIGSTAANPLYILDASGTSAWIVNQSIETAAALYIEVIPFVGEDLGYFLNETWTCESDFQTTPPTTCAFVTGVSQGSYASAVSQGYGENVSPLFIRQLGYSVAFPGTEVVFTGPFYAGEHIVISVPEPGTPLLIVVGVFVLFACAFWKKQGIPESI